MTALTLGNLATVDARQAPELLAASVSQALATSATFAVAVAPIDPGVADTAAFCAAYDVRLSSSANCVVLLGKRGDQWKWAAAVVLATTRADVNGTIKRLLDVRKVSFAPMDAAVSATGMEYGGITPIGLPAPWSVYIDRAVVEAGLVVIGSGLRKSKIVIAGASLAALPGAEVIDGLASEPTSSTR
ncbi:hypothetical protein EH165_13680 [Nakamurella antarctica]|uniref:YbaK/aminoacyl-tRNA synthetase-associated domain-containing protein n=1 Tax=Nakamurella antarctica TaxID=1902245 RepID=A0A3G8ZYC9_9ACTN|nr:YbaK/EbsC family protein [Nakamurella antarctica]AZI59036.1 hypothetical protein EH165_13680 [Nakamurella antarctica]